MRCAYANDVFSVEDLYIGHYRITKNQDKQKRIKYFIKTVVFLYNYDSFLPYLIFILHMPLKPQFCISAPRKSAVSEKRHFVAFYARKTKKVKNFILFLFKHIFIEFNYKVKNLYFI